MGDNRNFDEKRLVVWNAIAEKGSQEASEALSRLFNLPVKMMGSVKAYLPIPEVSRVENPEEEVLGARLVLTGDVTGEILFIIPVAAWTSWKCHLLPGPASLDLETSAFAEVSNIAGAFFTMNLSNKTALKMNFTPPEVIQDMFATAFEDTLVQISEEAHDVLIIETRLSISGDEVQGYLFFIPSQSSIELITRKFFAS